MPVLKEAITQLPELAPSFFTLDDARQAVLQLPGMESYVPDRFLPEVEIDRCLETMTAEAIYHIDADNMVAATAYYMGWPDAKRDEFFAHPDRIPYQSKLKFSGEYPEKVRQFLTIGTYLRLRWEHLKNEDTGEKTRQNLMIFHNFSTQNLFQGFYFDFLDRVYGIDSDQKRSGKLRRSIPEMVSLMDEECKKIAAQNDPEHSVHAHGLLNGKVKVATEGDNFSTIPSFLLNNSGDPDLREALKAIYERRMSDPVLTAEQLQILWATEVYGKIMGIDTDTYYEINMPPGTASGFEDKLLKYMARQDLTEEFKAHIEEEAPGFMGLPAEERDYYTLLTMRANHFGFPAVNRYDEALESRINRGWVYIYKIFPPSKLGAAEANERFKVFTPAWRGSYALRPLNINYFNAKKQLVNIHILNPREEENRFIGRAGHEEAHKTHIYLLQTAYDRIPEGIKEAFSQLVESQILSILKSKSGQETGNYQNWGDLGDAIISRRQAPYALTQITVRKEMDKLWKAGFHGWALPVGGAVKIMDIVAPQVIEWYSKAYPMYADSRSTLLNNLNIKPMDGLSYMFEAVSEKKEDYLDMNTVFRRRFGDQWLKDKDARAVLLYLMGESANNPDITSYGAAVLSLSKDIDQVYEKIKSWGISEEYI